MSKITEETFYFGRVTALMLLIAVAFGINGIICGKFYSAVGRNNSCCSFNPGK